MTSVFSRIFCILSRIVEHFVFVQCSNSSFKISQTFHLVLHDMYLVLFESQMHSESPHTVTYCRQRSNAVYGTGSMRLDGEWKEETYFQESQRHLWLSSSSNRKELYCEQLNTVQIRSKPIHTCIMYVWHMCTCMCV